MEAHMKIERISNEHIHKFQQIPCSDDKKQKTIVKPKLKVALKLGNTFKSKCKLVFNTTTGRKTVYGTIWNVTDQHLELKGGTSLLISSIEDIRLV